MLQSIILALLLLPTVGATGAEVPARKGPVNDHGGVFTVSEEKVLVEQVLAAEKATSVQIAILTVKSLEGDTIEDYAIKVGDAWRIGQKGVDNGVLIIQSVGDRKLRIETGKGAQGVLTDLVAKRIQTEEMVPRFKEKRFAAAYTAAIVRITKTLSKEFNPDAAAIPLAAVAPARAAQDNGIGIAMIVLIVVIVLIVAFVIIYLLVKGRSEPEEDEISSGGGFGDEAGSTAPLPTPTPSLSPNSSSSYKTHKAERQHDEYDRPAYIPMPIPIPTSHYDDSSSSSSGSSWSNPSSDDSPSFGDSGGGDYSGDSGGGFDGGGASSDY